MSKQYQCKFSDEWLVNENFKNWIKKDENDEHSAYCKYCCKRFSISGRGVNQVIAHMNGSKHKIKSPPTTGGQQTLTKSNGSVSSDSSNSSLTDTQNNKSPAASSSKQTTITGTISRENVVRAEILWALEVLSCNYSLNSCSKKGKLFSEMFPDSDIAKNFQMASTKTSYVVYYGLAPHFKELLFNNLEEATYIVPCFDESYNRVIKKGQMDVLVRYWDINLSRVNTRYVSSEFMGKASASDVLEKFETASSDLDKTKFIQVSSDGPNVNLKFLDLLNDKRKDEGLNELISIGTCGLHTVSRAFQNAEQSTDMGVKQLLTSMYKIFEESPSRRADYERITTATNIDFPLRFCPTRWVENANVASRAFNIWPKVVAIVEYWNGLPKYKQPGKGDPKQNKSYHVLLKKHTNPLVPLYFKFFESIATKLNAFLRRFQTDSPMVPFLVTKLEEVVRALCSKFILDKVMEDSGEVRKLIKIDVFDKNKQKVNVALGFTLKDEIKSMKKNGKVKDTQLLNFYSNTKMFLATLCNHLLTKTPLQSQFARCCRCFNPHIMAEYQPSCKKMFNKILEKLISCRHITTNQGDSAKSEYANFLQTIVNKNQSSFTDFNIDDDRLDVFLLSYLESCTRFPQLTEIVKFVMTLSHGQAASERGFSTNKNLLVENLHEESIKRQRIVIDHMESNNLDAFEVPIDQKLIKSVKGSHAKYVSDLAEKKKKTIENERSKKLEELSKDIRKLDQKKDLLESTIADLKKDSDEYSMKAENQTNIKDMKQSITKSNALKRAATEKQEELDKCLKEKKILLDKKANV